MRVLRAEPATGRSDRFVVAFANTELRAGNWGAQVRTATNNGQGFEHEDSVIVERRLDTQSKS